jgi:hypothetical protein
LNALLYTKPSTTPPARAWAERHHPGVVGEPAAGCIPSVPPARGWLGPARGEFLAPNSPLGPPPVLLADFWAAGRARNPLNFVRWVVPIKARGRYTLCSAIHRAEGVRRAWNSHFKLLAQVALANRACYTQMTSSRFSQAARRRQRSICAYAAWFIYRARRHTGHRPARRHRTTAAGIQHDPRAVHPKLN